MSKYTFNTDDRKIKVTVEINEPSMQVGKWDAAQLAMFLLDLWQKATATPIDTVCVDVTEEE